MKNFFTSNTKTKNKNENEERNEEKNKRGRNNDSIYDCDGLGRHNIDIYIPASPHTLAGILSTAQSPQQEFLKRRYSAELNQVDF